MGDIPRLALSVRQPWAWAIIFGGKDIENRSWQAVNHGLRQRGRVAIHASKGLGRDEYEMAAESVNEILRANGSELRCPAAADLVRGAIIGSVEVVDVVSESSSLWFFGPRGLVLRNPEVWTPIPAQGALGYFEWRQDLDLKVETPRWMLPPQEKPAKPGPAPKPIDNGPDLFR